MAGKNSKNINNTFCFTAGFILLLLFFSCKTTPHIPDDILTGVQFIPLDAGASVYLFTNVQETRSILDLLPIEELNDKQTRDLLDKTSYAVAAMFPPDSGRRFQLAAWGDYPSFQAGLAFTFNRYWKKQSSQSNGSYWYSAVNRLSISISSRQAFVAASLNDIPVNPQTTSTQGVKAPDGFFEFRADSPLSCWMENPKPAIDKMISDIGIPMQFPVQKLFINLYLVNDSNGKESYEAVLRFHLENPSQARGMISILNLASGFMQGSNQVIASLLFVNPPVQNGSSLDIKSGILNEEEILYFFNTFLNL